MGQFGNIFIVTVTKESHRSRHFKITLMDIRQGGHCKLSEISARSARLLASMYLMGVLSLWVGRS